MNKIWPLLVSKSSNKHCANGSRVGVIGMISSFHNTNCSRNLVNNAANKELHFLQIKGDVNLNKRLFWIIVSDISCFFLLKKVQQEETANIRDNNSE